MKLGNWATIFVLVLAAVSLYVFSRVTVDDAFITWRYGRNLIDFGIWNYNPSMLDPTQAYTNPLFAVLSVVPNLFSWDVVLFFKCLSVALLIAFVWWFGRRTNGSWLMILALVGLPATVIHVFGGLETFAFVVLMAALLIAAYENRMSCAIGLTLLLFATRPEAWPLVALVPLYFSISEPVGLDIRKVGLRNYLGTLTFLPFRFVRALIALAFPLAIYLWFHHQHFGSALPNTFYVKLAGSFSPQNFVIFALFVLPTAVLLPVAVLCWFGRIKLALMMAMLFGAMVVDYSASNLTMNYSGRFAFHIFVPAYLFFVYLASRLTGRLYISSSTESREPIALSQSTAAKGVLLFGLAAFAMISDNFSPRGATYYPRALAAHAALGKAIHRVAVKEGIRAFSLADAGMAAYQSDIDAFDSIGLASSAVARKGIDPALLDKYKVDLVVFHATAEGIRLDVFNQQKVYDWAVANGFKALCDIYFEKDYLLKVYARKPIAEIADVCATSKTMNDVTDRALFKSAVLVPPWKFWKE